MLAELNKRKEFLEHQREEAKKRHSEELGLIARELEKVKVDTGLCMADINPVKADLAREWINVEHTYVKSYDSTLHTSFGKGDTEQCLEEAVLAFSKDSTVFDKRYVGCKDYDRWVGQYHGWCEYGMGPRHGSITFRIEKVRKNRDQPVPPEAQEAVLWYLMRKVFIEEFKALKG